jgi:hypothetical protein
MLVGIEVALPRVLGLHGIPGAINVREEGTLTTLDVAAVSLNLQTSAEPPRSPKVSHVEAQSSVGSSQYRSLQFCPPQSHIKSVVATDAPPDSLLVASASPPLGKAEALGWTRPKATGAKPRV